MTRADVIVFSPGVIALGIIAFSVWRAWKHREPEREEFLRFLDEYEDNEVMTVGDAWEVIERRTFAEHAWMGLQKIPVAEPRRKIHW